MEILLRIKNRDLILNCDETMAAFSKRYLDLSTDGAWQRSSYNQG
jgi:hypothetical protein